MTPGPWTIERRQGFTIHAIGTDRDICIASVKMNPDIMTGFANAQGIAAVPDLVAALKECRSVLPTLIEDGDAARDREGRAVLARVQFALAKAGVQP